MQKNLKNIFCVIDFQLDHLPKDSLFSLPDLYGNEAWKQLYIGDRVMAGNAFRREVLKGHYPDVRLLSEKDRQNRSRYHKS